MQSITLTLAGAGYKIQELTLGQLEDIHVEMAQPFSGDAKELWARYRRIIAIGLSVDHSEITEDALRKMRLGTIQAAKLAADSIIEFGGFVKRTEAVSGEAPAGAPH